MASEEAGKNNNNNDQKVLIKCIVNKSARQTQDGDEGEDDDIQQFAAKEKSDMDAR